MKLLPCDLPQQREQRNLSHPKLGELVYNIPNPFTSNTVIYFRLYTQVAVKIKIYNNFMYLMEEINIDNASKGLNNINYNGSNLPFGIYQCILEVNGQQADSKAIIKTE
jgi:hypothetical protein